LFYFIRRHICWWSVQYKVWEQILVTKYFICRSWDGDILRMREPNIWAQSIKTNERVQKGCASDKIIRYIFALSKLNLSPSVYYIVSNLSKMLYNCKLHYVLKFVWNCAKNSWIRYWCTSTQRKRFLLKRTILSNIVLDSKW
jgi:hypothetical protein